MALQQKTPDHNGNKKYIRIVDNGYTYPLKFVIYLNKEERQREKDGFDRGTYEVPYYQQFSLSFNIPMDEYDAVEKESITDKVLTAQYTALKSYTEIDEYGNEYQPFGDCEDV